MTSAEYQDSHGMGSSEARKARETHNAFTTMVTFVTAAVVVRVA